MSILIRGMEMPKNCKECGICYVDGSGQGYCILKDEYSDCESTGLERRFDCPLVEVQPHGRLVDADELKEEITEEAINLRMNGLKGTPRSTENHRWAIDRLDEAPTIIEAEGRKE